MIASICRALGAIAVVVTMSAAPAEAAAAPGAATADASGRIGFTVVTPSPAASVSRAPTATAAPSPDPAAARPRFRVSVQPGSAGPGDEVTLSFETAVEGVEIVDCLAFFPHDAGGTCQRSPERWLVHTRVPADTKPGVTLLRWGVASRNADGRPGADSDVISYPVHAPATPTTKRPTSPATSDTAATGLPATAGRPPAFVAATDPESAAAGTPVTVTVSAVDAGAEVTGCVIAFPGQPGSPCGQTGGRWSATVQVPDGAPPGDLPLRWSATSRTPSGGPADGTIAYRVLAAGADAPPAFAVRPEPAAVRAGGRVTVSYQALVPGVSIARCSAGFDGRPMAECRRSGPGWVADVAVPEDAPPGAGALRWRVAYTRTGSGTPASTDGLVSFDVLAGAPAEPGGIWPNRLPIGVGVLLGGVVLAGLFGYRTVTRRLGGRRWWRRSADPVGLDADSVRVVPVIPTGPLDVQAGDPDAPPRHLVRLTIQRPPVDVQIHEEMP